VIWDARRQEVFSARDRIGNKPLNYYWDGTTLVFASEVHAILAMPWVPEDLNEGMVAEFLAAEWYSREETFWKGILRLDGAHRMVVDSAGPNLERYWTPDLWATLPCTNEDDYVDYYRQILTDAVRRQCRSFEPVACEVSGGLDSSAIFAVAERLRRQERLPAPGLEGYTLAFCDESDANELEYARAVGRHLDCKIQEILPTRKQLSWYQQWAHHYREFPSYPNAVMGLGIRESARDQRSRVLLVGVGGDEWLCGSRNYYADALAAKQWDELLTCFDLDRRDVGLSRSLWWVFRHGLAPRIPDGTVKQFLRKRLANDQRDVEGEVWLTPPMKRLLRQRRDTYLSSPAIKTRQIRRRKQSNTLSDAYAAHAREFEERMASSVGVELRRPYFDVDLIQFAFTIPDGYLLRGHTDKYLHRKALAHLLPPAVLTRTTKAEFSVTYRWLLPEIRQELMGKISKRVQDWVEPSEVDKLLGHADNLENSSWPVWMLWGLIGCEAMSSPRTTSKNGRLVFA
jgi:asparagine synthase (glutamine-hydrolysing)